MWRLGSPSSGSILMTCAPPSARICPAHGTAMKWPNSSTVTPANGRSSFTVSALHEAGELLRRHRAVDVPERPLVLYLAGRIEQARHRHAVERRGEADPLHASGFELRDAERLALDTDHEVERPRERRADGAHGRDVGQPRRHQHIRAELFERLQSFDHVVEVRVAPEE